jgi:hypothetical protein
MSVTHHHRTIEAPSLVQRAKVLIAYKLVNHDLAFLRALF